MKEEETISLLDFYLRDKWKQQGQDRPPVIFQITSKAYNFLIVDELDIL